MVSTKRLRQRDLMNSRSGMDFNYLNSVKHLPLLTAQGERELGQRRDHYRGSLLINTYRHDDLKDQFLTNLRRAYVIQWPWKKLRLKRHTRNYLGALIRNESDIDEIDLPYKGFIIEQQLEDLLLTTLREGIARENKSPGRLPLQFILEDYKHLIEAKNEFTIHNLSLVTNYVKNYCGRGVDTRDLAEEGNLGLMTAIDRWRWRRGYKFSSYAVNWIKQSMQRAIHNHGRDVRFPIHLIELFPKYLDAQRSHDFIDHKTGQLDSSKVADALSIKPLRAKALIQYIHAYHFKETSLTDGKYGKYEDSSLLDLLSDTHAVSPLETVIKKEIQKKVGELIKTLDEKEYKVISLRYGIGIRSEHTLRQIEDIMGFSHEHARKVVRQAKNKIRLMIGTRDNL